MYNKKNMYNEKKTVNLTAPLDFIEKTKKVFTLQIFLVVNL